MAYEFNISGIPDIARDVDKVCRTCPDELNTAMKKAAKGWKDLCNSKFPASYDSGKRPFRKNWTTKSTYGVTGIIEETEIANKAPHFHLVEEGHRKFDFHGNDTGGFVPGRHYAEQTREEWRTEFPKMVQEHLDRALDKGGF